MAIVTTGDLIADVRRQLDEYNTDAVDDPQIMAALNRAQRHALNIIAKQYDDFALAYKSVSVSSGDTTFTVPEEVYAGRIEMIEYLDNSSIPYPVKRKSYRQGTFSESSGGARRPRAWAQVGQAVKLYPKASADYTLRVWYTRKIEKLEKQLGRITAIDSVSSPNTLTVDSLVQYDADDTPTGLEAAAAASIGRLNCWFNVCDAQTGAIKGTYEAATLPGSNVINLDPTPTRTPVLNKTVAGTLASTIAVDDIVSNVRGTGVPELYGEAYQDYLVEYASYTIRRALGEAQQDDFTALKDLEREIERIWVGRENTSKIKKSSRRWNYGANRRRLLYS